MDLHQRVAAGEGQPAETLDCMQHELQNFSLAIHQPQPPAPAEHLGEVIQQYTDTLWYHTERVQPHKLLTARIYLFLMNMNLTSWRTGSLTLRWQQTSPAEGTARLA